jgi:hypothetical protein
MMQGQQNIKLPTKLCCLTWDRGELSYLATLGSEKFPPRISSTFFRGEGGGITPQAESNTTPPSPKIEITNILFYILNFASIIKFKMFLFFNILSQQETKTVPSYLPP